MLWLGVQLPEWRYPVVAQLDAGELRFDNYNGHWGKPEHLDKCVNRFFLSTARELLI